MRPIDADALKEEICKQYRHFGQRIAVSPVFEAIKKAPTVLNCPNCGAPITGERCEYCGSVFYDWACLNADKPFFIKIKRGNDLVIAKTVLDHIKITEDDDPITLYADNNPYKTIHKANITIDASFRVVPFDTHGNNDVLFVRMDTDICNTPMEEFKDE